MNRIVVEEYIAFKCIECGMISVFPKSKGDGNSCLECIGAILPIGDARVKLRNTTSMSIGVSVDTTQLDEALDKAERLSKLLSDIHSIPPIK